MNIQNAYNEWAETYDSSENLTRDLDRVVIEKALSGCAFRTVLEVGCGTGKNTGFLSKIGKIVYAVDFSEGMINEAKSSINSDNVKFTLTDITHEWPFKDNFFDLATCNLILEHIDDLSFIFSEANRILKNNGKFFISEFHPYQQYLGKKPRYHKDGDLFEIDSFVHNISDFLHAAKIAGLRFVDLKEWRIEEGKDKPPRIISFMFEKSDNG